MPAGDVHGRGSESRDRQAVRNCDREGVVARRFNRANADENQREGSDEFCDARTKLFHRAIQAKRSDNDNSVAVALLAAPQLYEGGWATPGPLALRTAKRLQKTIPP